MEGDSAPAKITSSKESGNLDTGNGTTLPSAGGDGGLANETGALKHEVNLPDNGEGLPEASGRTVPERAGTDPGEVRADSAAVKIQRWYRQRREERATREVQSFLLGKKDELNRSRREEREKVRNEMTAWAHQARCDYRFSPTPSPSPPPLQAAGKREHEAELQRRRLAKMQAVRKAAIEDLQRRREEKRQAVEKIAQEEIVSHTAEMGCRVSVFIAPPTGPPAGQRQDQEVQGARQAEEGRESERGRGRGGESGRGSAYVISTRLCHR